MVWLCSGPPLQQHTAASNLRPPSACHFLCDSCWNPWQGGCLGEKDPPSSFSSPPSSPWQCPQKRAGSRLASKVRMLPPLPCGLSIHKAPLLCLPTGVYVGFAFLLGGVNISHKLSTSGHDFPPKRGRVPCKGKKKLWEHFWCKYYFFKRKAKQI